MGAHMLLLSLLTALVVLLIFGFAIKYGDRAIRLGAIWLVVNMSLHFVLSLGGRASPTLHLIDDGIYATGLLPLAFFTVSYWIGVLALLACGSFILQSVYLLADRPTDWTYAHINDAITVCCLLTLIAGGVASILERRKERREEAQAQTPLPASAAA
jgi:hypothetical protein